MKTLVLSVFTVLSIYSFSQKPFNHYDMSNLDSLEVCKIQNLTPDTIEKIMNQHILNYADTFVPEDPYYQYYLDHFRLLGENEYDYYIIDAAKDSVYWSEYYYNRTINNMLFYNKWSEFFEYNPGSYAIEGGDEAYSIVDGDFGELPCYSYTLPEDISRGDTLVVSQVGDSSIYVESLYHKSISIKSKYKDFRDHDLLNEIKDTLVYFSEKNVEIMLGTGHTYFRVKVLMNRVKLIQYNDKIVYYLVIYIVPYGVLNIVPYSYIKRRLKRSWFFIENYYNIF